MAFWTDCPITALGDKPNELAPIRQCHPIFYDGDKYVTVMVEGIKTSFKAGYLYTAPGRLGEVPTADPTAFLVNGAASC